MLQTLILGLISGGIYGLLALAIVLVYRGSRVLNFALGEIGTVSLFVVWWLVHEHHWPYAVGAAAAILVATSIGLVFERLVVRNMLEAPRLAVAVATIGLLTFLLTVELYTNGPVGRDASAPIGGKGVDIAGVVVSPTQILALVVTIAVGLALAALLKRTDFGLGVLAAASDPTAVRLVGVKLSRVSAFTWGVGAAISAVAALLTAPTVTLFAPGYVSELFLYAMAGAVVGGLSSLPGAFVGGILIGILQSAVQHETTVHSVSVPGTDVVAIFALILAILLFRPQGLLGRAER